MGMECKHTSASSVLCFASSPSSDTRTFLGGGLKKESIVLFFVVSAILSSNSCAMDAKRSFPLTLSPVATFSLVRSRRHDAPANPFLLYPSPVHFKISPDLEAATFLSPSFMFPNHDKQKCRCVFLHSQTISITNKLLRTKRQKQKTQCLSSAHPSSVLQAPSSTALSSRKRFPSRLPGYTTRGISQNIGRSWRVVEIRWS